MKEAWRDVVGEEDRYQVSSLGRVRRSAVTLTMPGRWGLMSRRPKQRLLAASPLSDGYAQVKLPHLGSVRVHTLVATAFIGPPPFPLAHVNHIDSNKANNRLSNLEWTTASENALHSFRTTARAGSAKGKFGSKNPSSIPVVATCVRTGKETRYAAAADAARTGQFGSGAISRACAGQLSAYKGYRWRYERGYGRGVHP